MKARAHLLAAAIGVAVLSCLTLGLLVVHARHLPAPTAEGKSLFPRQFEQEPDVPAGSTRWFAAANKAADRQLHVEVPRRPRAYALVVFCVGGDFSLDAGGFGEVSGPCTGRLSPSFGAYAGHPAERWLMTTSQRQPRDWGFAVYLWPPDYNG